MNKLNDGKKKCRFCDDILEYGYDKNAMLHCQSCHRIWDGFAQCPCWMDLASSSDSDDDHEVDGSVQKKPETLDEKKSN